MFNHYKKFKELLSFKNCFYIKEYPMDYDKINMYIPVLIQVQSVLGVCRPGTAGISYSTGKEHENFKHP